MRDFQTNFYPRFTLMEAFWEPCSCDQIFVTNKVLVANDRSKRTYSTCRTHSARFCDPETLLGHLCTPTNIAPRAITKKWQILNFHDFCNVTPESCAANTRKRSESIRGALKTCSSVLLHCSHSYFRFYEWFSEEILSSFHSVGSFPGAMFMRSDLCG